ncbi:hypothetical protein Tco_1569994 [Tanacetum coccineum]
MFRYGNTNVDAIKLKLFPSSLAGDAKVWFNKLSSGVITTWEEIRQAFDLLCSCHRHGLGRGTIIQIFYHGLDEATQAILDAVGSFLYKTPNEAHRLLEDQFKDINGEMKEMQDGCNSCRRPHPSSECDDKPMGGPKDKEANYAYGGYRGGEFITFNVEEIPKQEEEVEDNFKELPLKENLRNKTSIQDPPTDLELKSLPKHLEYAFLEKDSLLPVVISALLKDDEKKRLISVLKRHKEAFALDNIRYSEN